ncbi:MAG: hypothetical protein IPQ07_00135 [Myxococcales bacterium]|nr:hypothetical protein [Myxococcales bacterium]
METTSTSSQLSQLMTLTCRGELAQPMTRANETALTIAALVAGLFLSSLWGIAAGSSSAAMALANAYKVPMVILLSALAALPAGLVALRFANARLAARELISAFMTSLFGGTLVLATLAPLVAVYYHTSSKAGVPLALGSVFVSLATATLLFGRAVKRKVGSAPGRSSSLVPVVILVALFSAALMQFVALAAPIIGTVTQWSGGFDSVFGR